MGGFVSFHNRVYGSSHEHHHFTTWHFSEILGCSREEATRRGIEFYHSPDHQKLELVDGAREALRFLALHYELVAITARELSRSARMLELIDQHLFGLFASVHFLGHTKCKGEFCTEIGGVAFMVDDGLHNAEAVGGNGMPVYLMDRPWNQTEVLPPNTIRVHHWDDVIIDLL